MKVEKPQENFHRFVRRTKMKITRETLKQMIAEEVAKMDPQNEGFGDIVKGTGKYLGSKIGMDTDKPGMQFAAKINAALSQVGFSPQEAGDSVSQYSRNAVPNLVKMGEKAAQKLYADEGKRPQLVQVAQKVAAEINKWDSSSESAKQAQQFGSGQYSPNDKVEGVIAAAAGFVEKIDDFERYQNFAASQNESHLRSGMHNLKKIVAEEIVKMELENLGK